MPGVPDEQWDYTPHAGFVEHTKNLLRISKRAGSVDAGEENNIRRMKNYYLPLIFQSMANLTFFFEAISQHPELRKEYQSATMDLLGVTRLNPRKNLYAFMFRDLVYGMLSIGTTEADFRIRLVDILEEIIWRKIVGLKILETLDTSKRVIDEIGHPRLWTEMLAQRVPDVYKFEVLRHGIENKMGDKKHPGGTENQRNKAFDDHAKKNAPARTFTFNTEELLKEKE